MASERITIRVSKTLGDLLKSRSRSNGRTPSEVVRLALENYLGSESREQSAYELAQSAGLVGSLRRAPKDLSLAKRHFEGFGKSK
jgi:metal-responsive CopG/Arc/MetJ family transcriptional regulator